MKTNAMNTLEKIKCVRAFQTGKFRAQWKTTERIGRHLILWLSGLDEHTTVVLTIIIIIITNDYAKNNSVYYTIIIIKKRPKLNDDINITIAIRK